MIQSVSDLLIESLFSKSNKFLLFGQVVFYSILLTLDIFLVDWYKNFYDSIIGDNWEEFVDQVIIFVLIVSLQALMYGCIANVSEMLDVSIKIKLVNSKINGFKNSRPGTEKLEQQLIEDSLLIADKLSGLAPSTIFNIFKIFTFIYIILTYKDTVNFLWYSFQSGYILLCGFLLTTAIQLYFTSKGNKTIGKSENLKRKAELNFRKSIREASNSNKAFIGSVKYTKTIYSIRKISSRKIGGITTIINLANSLSLIIPFTILFQLHQQGLFTIGELMKIAAIYGFLSNSSLQIFNSYPELFKVISATRRLIND